jgi:membrane-associated phospholipid phosphatase
MATRGKSRAVRIVALWAMAIAAAAMLDRAMASWVHSAGIDAFMLAHKPVCEAIKIPGYFAFTIGVSVVVAVTHRMGWRGALFLLISTSMAAANQLLKWMAGRCRPFHTLSGDSQALTPFDLHPFPGFNARNLCFPSGHAALAFATAAALGILLPRWRWAFYVLATLVAVERVLENAHWLSDTVCAAALGVGGVWIVRHLLWETISRTNEHGRNTLPVAGDSSV